MSTYIHRRPERHPVREMGADRWNFSGSHPYPKLTCVENHGVLSKEPLVDESEGMGWRFPSAIIRERAILSREIRWARALFIYHLIGTRKKQQETTKKQKRKKKNKNLENPQPGEGKLGLSIDVPPDHHSPFRDQITKQ